MKNIKIFLTLILLIISFSRISYSQEWEEQAIGSVGTEDFINLNHGWTVVSGSQGFTVLKTINKGLSWDSIYGFIGYSNSANISVDLVNINLGFIYYGSKVIKTSDGGQNWQTVYDFNPGNDPNMNSIRPLIKFYNNDTGYISFTRTDRTDGVKIFRTTNSGTTWEQKMHYPQDLGGIFYYVYTDLTFENNNHDIITFCGYGGYTNRSDLRYFGARSTNGGATFDAFGGSNGANKYQLKYLNNLPGQSQVYKMIMIENISNSDRGTYCYDFVNGNFGNKYKINDNINFDNVGGLIFADQNNGYVIINRELYKTTNSGVNWNVFYTTQGNTATGGNSHILEVFGDQIYLGAFNGSFYTKKLTTNILSFFDNQSVSSSFLFDGNSISTPISDYLRGGFTSLSCSNIINAGQTNERIFYKWSDNFMNASHDVGNSHGHDFYFDMSGTTIANYYKTKKLSTISGAIANLSQTKSIRDTIINGITATHTIHESMGGIFYAKSTNFGATYQTEEPVNHSLEGASDGNKNASLCMISKGGNSGSITSLDPERNVAVVWERYNSFTNKVEIKLARRELKSDATGYVWNDSNKIITSFDGPSAFQSFPKCFIAGSPIDSAGFYFHVVVVPYLKYSAGGTKLMVSVRNLNHSQDYELDYGEISDLSVVNLRNNYRVFEIHFAYKKGNAIVYRNETVGVDPAIGIYHNLNELKNDISSGDGYASRYKPDISLMNGIPVVSYSANYNAYAMIDYESGGTDIIQISRYPVIKVERKGINDWGDYIIYNSVNVQANPDIEGSANTKSYLINYSAGNGLFKKVVNVESHPGYFCDPNTFSGTDSRLIKNSYTGYFGNSLSLLTLSPNAGLYKLDKQNFNITNIVTADAYDNLGGVINLDTVRYSFNLGPLLVKEPDDEIEEISFDPKYTPPAPVMTPVEFNQNLRSNPFLLNESQALLVGCNVTYLKDDIDALINEVRYSVDLMNKSTDSLHRVLYSDTIHADDSIATEYLRGYYITGIPNGEDSFYVKITVNNEDIAEGNFYINPGYDDNTGAGDNSLGYRTKIIFENSVVENTTNIIPGEYSLEQNYPNPFNPTTNLEFGISDLGFVSLKVYDLLGKEVKTLVNENLKTGRYKVEFDGSGLSSGIYFYKLEAGSFTSVKRMLLIK